MCALLLSTLLAACARVEAAPQTEIALPVRLSELLARVSSEAQAGVDLRLELVDGARSALPHALLELTWEEGGRTAFQSDEQGRLHLRFHRPFPVGEATLRLCDIPAGQEFVDAEYEQYTHRVEDGKLLVRALEAGT